MGQVHRPRGAAASTRAPLPTLTIRPIETRVFEAGEDLAAFIAESVPAEWIGLANGQNGAERRIVAVTSKIVSLAEGRLVSRDEIGKTELVRREADVFLGEVGYGTYLTIKEGLMIPSAGIDESNSASGAYILYPENPLESARKLWERLRDLWQVKDLGVLLTDSHTSPLRRGVTGVCLAYWGFKGVRSMVGSRDLFGRELAMTQMNMVDGLAASAVLMMGEGRERRPLAWIAGAEVEFCEKSDPAELKIPLEQDLYSPLLSSFQSSRN